jgi:cytoskeletal protein RodZ
MGISDDIRPRKLVHYENKFEELHHKKQAESHQNEAIIIDNISPEKTEEFDDKPTKAKFGDNFFESTKDEQIVEKPKKAKKSSGIFKKVILYLTIVLVLATIAVVGYQNKDLFIKDKNTTNASNQSTTNSSDTDTYQNEITPTDYTSSTDSSTQNSADTQSNSNTNSSTTSSSITPSSSQS